MKVIILVPSPQYMHNAGARIRYRRLSAHAGSRLQISLEDIAQFDPRTASCDLLIVSKCHDARSLLAARIVGQRGIRVGVDLFDDYFSQSADSRLNRFRVWLRQLLPLCDFAMCSTAAMAEVISQYREDLPLFVMNDPASPLDDVRLTQVLQDKLSDARTERRLRLGWFGVGDNPHFPVGLSDLAAFADMLARLGSEGRAVELTILTNVRSLNADRLAMITDLPVPTAVREWSEQAEAELLDQSFACFVPVNAQQFSVAKSLNRAVTALAAGCQVISAGYPLYRALDVFVYRDMDSLVEDMHTTRLRLAPDTVGAFRTAIDVLASAEHEAEAFAQFLEQLPSRIAADESAALFLIHGHSTNGAAHKMVQAVGGLSVASPFCSVPLDFDVVFQARPGRGVAMLVSDKGLSRMRPDRRAEAAAFGAIGKRNFWEIAEGSNARSARLAWTDPSLSLQLALYPSVMRKVLDDLEANFGAGCAIISEYSTLPFEPVV